MPKPHRLAFELLEDRLTPNGGLDPTFGAGGVSLITEEEFDRPYGMAVRPDGRIVVLGDRNLGSGAAVARMNPDGSLDKTFGGGDGVATFGNALYTPSAIALGPDGSVLVLTVWSDGFSANEVIVRFTEAGELDTTFGDGGLAAVPHDPTSPVLVLGLHGLTVLPDGSVVATGARPDQNPDSLLAVVRLTAKGTPDEAFGPDGVRTYKVGPWAEGDTVVQNPDGSLLVVGRVGRPAAFYATNTAYSAVVVRLTAAGDLDPTYGDGGQAVVTQADYTVTQLSAALAPDGGLVLGLSGYGAALPGGGLSSGSAVAKLTPDGKPDAAFGGDGQIDVATGGGEKVGDLLGATPLPDGRVLGYFPSQPGFAVLALDKGGAPDPEFGTEGWLRIVTPAGYRSGSIALPWPVAGAIDPLPDGRVVVLGQNTDVRVGPGQTLVAALVLDEPGPALKGAVRADVNGDGVNDLILPAGPTDSQIRVQDGRNGDTLVEPFTVFEPSFTGGVTFAAADLDGDGRAELVAVPGGGGSGRVNVYRGADLAAGKTDPALSFFGIDDVNFRGGARAAVGDVNGDGTPDLTVAAGEGGGPRVAVFDGRGALAGGQAPPKLVGDFFAFEPSLRDGATVAAGDVSGDGAADLVFGGGPGGAPRVRIVDARQILASAPFRFLDEVTAARIADFFAGDAAQRAGTQVTVRDDGDVVALTPEQVAAEAMTSEVLAVRHVQLYTAATLRANPAPAPDVDLDTLGVDVSATGVHVG